jgi:DNA polymerase-1
VTVPDRSWCDPLVGATLHTGTNAVEAGRRMPEGHLLAADIETPGLNTFTMNCITCAWEQDGRTHSILLDPREPGHRTLFSEMTTRCGQIVFHNGAFDVPILWHHGLMDRPAVAKVTDTIIHARLAYPDPYIPKSLEKLACEHLGLTELSGGMLKSFKAAGYKTKQAGYEGMSIESPIYRLGAMVDTVATLHLEPILKEKAVHWLTDHPFQTGGATTREQALEIIATQHTVNRVMLRRSAVGLAVDPDYLARYSESVDIDKQRAISLLAQHSDAKGPLVGGASKGGRIVDYLDSINALPAHWPRTKTGKLKAAKDDLDNLDHPLAQAQRTLAQIEKIEQYITKVQTQYETTGRCHPQVAILGASQSGRMSVSGPEYHQFSELARPIIADDGQGLTSIDWSQIEPVTMALMAKDSEFLAPFEAGSDLYEPIQRACGLTMDKKGRGTAKIVLLAAMYGQSVRSLAEVLGHTTESAAQLRRQLFAAMPECAKWMTKVTGVAETYRRVVTVGGRILPVTDEGSYKSVNHTCQGSAYDILAHTIVRMEEEGIGDHVQLAMHDEVVVDTDVAEHVQKIMETPPEFLTRWAGREFQLRTDRADMGHYWQKV